MKKKELRQALLVQNCRVDDLTTALIKAEERIKHLMNKAYIQTDGPLLISVKDELEFANQKITQLEKAIQDFENELKSK